MSESNPFKLMERLPVQAGLHGALQDHRLSRCFDRAQSGYFPPEEVIGTLTEIYQVDVFRLETFGKLARKLGFEEDRVAELLRDRGASYHPETGWVFPPDDENAPVFVPGEGWRNRSYIREGKVIF